jgi:predicted sulfurtransferase
MKTTLSKIVLILASIVILAAMTGEAARAADVPRMSKEDLKAMLGDPDLIILDVRAGRDWDSSEFKIQGAERANPSDFNTWAGKYPAAKTIVLYCA